MKKLGSSILVLCLNESVGSGLSKELADFLGLHFANAKQIVEYDLFDSEDMIKKCGMAYFKKREKSSLKSLSNFEDSVIFLNYDLFVNNQTSYKKISPKIYVKIAKRKLDKKNDVINLMAYEERDKLLQEKADVTVEVSGESKGALNKIIKELKRNYEKNS